MLVVNPGARGVTPAVIAATVAQWSSTGQLDVIRSRARHLDGLGPLAAKADAVVVLGGDGVLNQVANLLASLGSDAAVVPLPAGTTNVVARNLGLPRQLRAASDMAITALREGSSARRGWGRLNGRGFLANAGIGIDAAVVARTEAHLNAKRRLGHVMFGLAALAEARGAVRSARLHVQRDDETAGGERAGDVCWVLALAGHPYSYAGPRPLRVLGPTDRPDTGPRGHLSVLCFEPGGARRLAALAARAAFSRAGVADRPGVVHCSLSGSIELTSPVAIPAQTDGEPMVPARHFQLRYEPDALRLIVPYL
ncbi:MAG: diacylglycerol/lipid kinase family protein [Acidimicrobiales bacterium]